MVRQLSPPALLGAQAEETGEVYLVLLTINSADLAAPLRFSNDAVNTLSRGDVYQAFPFGAIFPPDLPGEIRPIQLRIDNIDRQIVNALRTTQETITVLMEAITAATPDTIEATFAFDVVSASYGVTDASLTLAYEQILDEPFPYQRFTTNAAPGLF